MKQLSLAAIPLVLLASPSPTSAQDGEPIGDGRFSFLPGVWSVRGHAALDPSTRQQLDALMVVAPWSDGLLTGYAKRAYARADLPAGFDDFTEAGLAALTPSSTGYWAWDESASGWVSLAGWRPDYVDRARSFEVADGGLVAEPAPGSDPTGTFVDHQSFEGVGFEGFTFRVRRVYDGGAVVDVCVLEARREDDRASPWHTQLAGGEEARVTTLLEGFGGSRGMAIDEAGTLYFAGDLEGSGDAPILARSPEGELRVLARGLAPAGLAWHDGHLYVHAHDVEGGRVVRVDQGGEVEELGRLPGDPLAVDRAGRVYTLVGDEILRLKGDGEPEVWARSPLLQGGFALTADRSTDELVVGIWTGGQVYRVREGGEPVLVGRLTGSGRGRCAWITMDGADVLATSFGGSRVLRLRPDGTLELVAGHGLVGDRDGGGREARFHNPNGIALSPDGRFVYVAEIRPGPDGPFAHGRLRRVELSRR